MIIGIVCCDNKWSIGKNNDLLFNLPVDMKHFRTETSNAIVVCGMNTLLSFPGSKPLKGRSTIVLCPPDYERDDCFCIHSFDECLRLVKELSKTRHVYIIGGAMLYHSFLPYYDQVLVTKVEADGNGTVFFPNLDENQDFDREPISNPLQDGDYNIRFWSYTRK